MVDPYSTETLFRVFEATLVVFWAGFFATTLRPAFRGWYGGWEFVHDPHGLIPGLIETEKSNPYHGVGRLPRAIGAVTAIAAGLAVYALGAVVVLLTIFVYVLATGTGVSGVDWFFYFIGAAIHVTVWVQMEATVRVQQSKWYLGY